MRILITGGAGFIGSAVVRHCLRGTHHYVFNIDKLTYASNVDNLKDALPHGRYGFEQIDICDEPALARAFDGYQPDAVMHLAAESHVDRSIQEPGAFIQTNIVGTGTLLAVAQAYYERLTPDRRRSFRFHHVSTDEVYGSVAGNEISGEEAACAPNSPYAASKASSDLLARAWHRTYGLPIVISRSSNNYGPYQFPEKLIPTVIMAALEGRSIPVYGTGENVRDWIFVEDHVRALLQVMEHGKVGQCYNVGTGYGVRNIDLVRLLCRTLDELKPAGGAASAERLIAFVEDRPGHDHRYAIDTAKIRRELGWHPQIALEEGIRRTLTWYLGNRWWWEAIRDRGFGRSRLGLRSPVRDQVLSQ